MIRTGSRSFFLASLLLPEQVRGGAYALYAFCRLSDDTVDVEQGGEAAIARLAARLDAVYAGDPADSAVDTALFDAVRRHAIPRAPFDALLAGMKWDAAGRGCETLSDLQAYAVRVAGSVGLMMAALMSARSPDLVSRACDLGVAMQLTNVARDVGEDARNGRLYLPRDWMREAGLDPDAWLARPQFNPAIATVVRRVLERADAFYLRADAGIAMLNPAFRPAIYAARRLYAEIGAEVVRHGYDSVSRRAVVPASRKLQLVARVLARQWRAPEAATLAAPAVSEAGVLVDAVLAESAAVLEPVPARGLRHGLRWTVELFAALDERPRRLA